MQKPQKCWNAKSLPEPDIVLELMQSIGVGKTLACLMAQRGIQDYAKAKEYFNPSLLQQHDPYQMKDLHKAVERLQKAVENEEPILFYGDYDVDGTTSVALCYLYFKQFYEYIHFYVPHRQKEGYGISQQGVQFAIDNHFGVMVALDCGIKAHNAIAFAAENHLDVIVCDHHEPGDKLPPAFAVLDPKRPDCQYPYKSLSGCGVGFKLLVALHQKLAGYAPKGPEHFVDLLAVSIACDIVPVTGENRILASAGLAKLNQEPLPGLAAMKAQIGYNEPYTITDVVFKIGPRINAAGRLEHAQKAVELLIGQDADQNEEQSAQIHQLNQDRRSLEKTITAECLAMMEDYNPEAVSTVLYSSDWHKGVIGIVASKIIEYFYRPTIVLTQSGDDVATGSARSIPEFDLYDALNDCDSLLEQWGGHTAAAGMTLKIDNIPAFREAFDNAVRKRLTKDLLVPKMTYDLELPIAELSWRFFNTVKRLGPFGPSNLRPRFVSKKVEPLKMRVVGAEHLKFTVFNGSQHIDCIGFGLGHWFEEYDTDDIWDICYCLDTNQWQGNTFLQLDIKDIRKHD